MVVPVTGLPVSGTPLSYSPELERLEIELLLEAVYRHYGFDFRSYAYASIRRRLWKRVEGEGLTSISELQARILHDTDAMERLLLDLSVNVTAMFRDPSFYKEFRELVVPMLRTYPFLRIWHAGCSTGEEVFSMAILLEEEGLYERARLYATDINDVVQNRVHSLFYDSLVMLGILALGSKESLKFSQYESCYEKLSSAEKLYRKMR